MKYHCETATLGRKPPPKRLPPEPESDPADQEVAVKQLRLLCGALKGSAG
jgi:hypothetical protein